MSIAALTQLYDEMRRLAIAGSNVAVGNARLEKLITPLQKSGEKAPVFAKVAQATQAVVDSSEKTAPGALLDLAALVNAILYTQGTTGIAGTLESIETTDLGARQTQTSARMIKPLLEALTTTGSGRLETIRDAFERGAFGDLRLVKPALGALDDGYPEIADFIADKVLPLYGKAILPELRRAFDLKGKGGSARRLKLMQELDPVGTREIVKQVLDDGSKELRVVAIECLGGSDEDLAFLLEQSRSRAKEVRVSALRALTKINAAEAVEAIQIATGGADLETLIDALSETKNPALMQFTLNAIEQQLDALFGLKDKREQGTAISRLSLWLKCVHGRVDPGAEEVLLKCFGHSRKLAEIKSEPSGKDINELVCMLMARSTMRLRERLIDAKETLDASGLSQAFFAARRTLKPEKVFELFSPLLQSAVRKMPKKGTAASDRLAALVLRLQELAHGLGYDWDRLRCRPSDGVARPLDPRWLDLAVAFGDQDLVCTIMRPGHAAANEFLLNRFKTAKDGHRLIWEMVRMQHPQSIDCVVQVLEERGTSDAYWICRLIPELPSEAVPRLEALVPRLPERVADRVVASLAELKHRTSTAATP